LAEAAVLPQQGAEDLEDAASREEAALREVAGRARPLTLARDRCLPVLPALASLLPEAGLRRGSTVAVSGSVALAMALLAGPSAAGSWGAVVGLPSLGAEAAAEMGVALERLALVPEPGIERWPVVVAALLEDLDIVLAVPPPRVRAAHARRLSARARERDGVLVVLGSRGLGAEPVDLQLAVKDGRWTGLGRGHGRLVARQVEVVARGRRAAARERRARLWLPAPGGEVMLADDDPGLAGLVATG
jgi:hypothetical protein